MMEELVMKKSKVIMIGAGLANMAAAVYLDLSQYLGHDLWEFFRDSSGWVSHRFDQPSNQNRLTADRSDEVEALWKSRKKNVGGS